MASKELQDRSDSHVHPFDVGRWTLYKQESGLESPRANSMYHPETIERLELNRSRMADRQSPPPNILPLSQSGPQTLLTEVEVEYQCAQRGDEK